MDIPQAIVFLLVILAIIYGLKGRDILNSFFKLSLLNAGIYLLIAVIAYSVQVYNIWHNRVINNHIYTNILMITEFTFLLSAAHTILKSSNVRWLIYFAGFVFGFAFSLHTIQIGFNISFVNGESISSILLTLVYLVLLNQFFRVNQKVWWKSPEILTTFGVLLYFAASVPLLAMSNYLIEHHLKMYTILWDFINYGFAILRYALLAFSFYLIYKEARNVKISA